MTVSLGGGLIAQAMHLPAGLLMGGAVAVSVAAVAGMRPFLPKPWRDTAFVIVGMTLGTNVAHDSLDQISHWPWTLVGLAVSLAIIVMGSGVLLYRFFGVDRMSSYLSSFPGHLSFVLGIAESGYGDPQRIAVIQSIRVLLLSVLVPVVARFYTDHDLSILPVRPVMDLAHLFFLAIACALGGFVARWLKIPAAFVLGSMIVAMAGKLMGFYDGILPPPLTWFSYISMGALIGSRFSGTTLSALWRASLGGVLVTLVAVVMTTAAAAALATITGMPFGQIWLGLSPGALESMGALGIALGFDTAFIAAHHTARFLFLTLGVPAVIALASKPPASDGSAVK